MLLGVYLPFKDIKEKTFAPPALRMTYRERGDNVQLKVTKLIYCPYRRFQFRSNNRRNYRCLHCQLELPPKTPAFHVHV